MPNELLLRVTLHGGILPGAVTLITLALLWWRHAKKNKHAETPTTGPVWALPLLLAVSDTGAFSANAKSGASATSAAHAASAPGFGMR